MTRSPVSAINSPSRSLTTAGISERSWSASTASAASPSSLIRRVRCRVAATAAGSSPWSSSPTGTVTYDAKLAMTSERHSGGRTLIGMVIDTRPVGAPLLSFQRRTATASAPNSTSLTVAPSRRWPATARVSSEPSSSSAKPYARLPSPPRPATRAGGNAERTRCSTSRVARVSRSAGEPVTRPLRSRTAKGSTAGSGSGSPA